jgi:hypothetical protein
MDVVIVSAYAVVAAGAVAGGIVLARLLWRRVRPRERGTVERAGRDRRQREEPVVWDRRVRPRRLEDLAKGFLAGFDGGTGAGAR